MASAKNPQTDTVSERSYQSGQGFAMTRVVKAITGAGENTLRLRAERGNSIGHTKATVERFDGTQWVQIEHANGWDLLAGDDNNAPSYVEWRNSRTKCVRWLATACDEVLDRALTWLP